MVMNPNNLGRRTYLHLLSHQGHIAYYLGCIFDTHTIVGFTIVPQEIHHTISFHLQESDKGPGFLIDLGDTYQVVYNRRRGELFVCGFWVPCDNDEPFIDQIKSYIKLIPRNKVLPPIPTGLYLPSPFFYHPPMMSESILYPPLPPPQSRSKLFQKNCASCTRSHRRCIFESTGDRQCMRCCKMHLICYFIPSGELIDFGFPFC